VILKLIEKEFLLDNIWAFRFEPSEPLEWIAGQYISVELPHNNPDGKGAKRWFTISSAPYEKIIQITTRVTDSSFKQALSHLPIGGDLQLLDTPHGSFVWQDGSRPLVFVAGGIGVTPFRSILKQRVHDKLALNATLIYASRSSEVPFKAEIDEWIKQDDNLVVHFVEGGPLTVEQLIQLAPELDESLIYLSGSQPMVLALIDGLENCGIPDVYLKRELFPSYTKNNY
jgi:ferredoxin-NADP reductase